MATTNVNTTSTSITSTSTAISTKKKKQYKLVVLDNKKNIAKTIAQWKPTFEDYVNNAVLSVGANFEIKIDALGFDDLSEAVANGQYDFTYTNTGHSGILSHLWGLHVAAAIENKRLGKRTSLFGGAVFTHDESGVKTMTDCITSNTNIAAVSKKSFGGFITQLKELADRGVDVQTKIDREKDVIFTGSHEKVMRLVSQRNVTCGFIRTDKYEGALERYPEVTPNLIHLDQKEGIEYTGLFPFRISTNLYPEWVVTARPTTVNERDEAVFLKALLNITQDDNAAILGQYSRWYPPVNMSTVMDALFETGEIQRSYEMNHLGSYYNVGVVLSSIVLLGSLVFATWTFAFRQERVVKASQPLFLGLICLGTAIMGVSILFLGIDESRGASIEFCSISCMIVPWLFFIGFTVCFSALFSKIYRINILFASAKKFKRIQVRVQDVLAPFLCLLFGNILLLSIWTIVNPLTWTRMDYGKAQDGVTIISKGVCSWKNSEDTTLVKIIVFILATTNVTALFCTNYQAYKARFISVEYSEGQYILLSSLFMAQISILSVPLFFLQYSEPIPSYLVKSIFIFVICLSIMSFIFLPKLYHFFLATKKRRSLQKQQQNYRPDFQTDGSTQRLTSGGEGLKVTASFFVRNKQKFRCQKCGHEPTSEYFGISSHDLSKHSKNNNTNPNIDGHHCIENCSNDEKGNDCMRDSNDLDANHPGKQEETEGGSKIQSSLFTDNNNNNRGKTKKRLSFADQCDIITEEDQTSCKNVLSGEL